MALGSSVSVVVIVSFDGVRGCERDAVREPVNGEWDRLRDREPDGPRDSDGDAVMRGDRVARGVAVRGTVGVRAPVSVFGGCLVTEDERVSGAEGVGVPMEGVAVRGDSVRENEPNDGVARLTVVVTVTVSDVDGVCVSEARWPDTVSVSVTVVVSVRECEGVALWLPVRRDTDRDGVVVRGGLTVCVGRLDGVRVGTRSRECVTGSDTLGVFLDFDTVGRKL